MCELLVIPGIDDEKKVIRRTLDVDAGEGPRPPPIPVPVPVPIPAPSEFQIKLQAAFTADVAKGATIVNLKKLAATYRGMAMTTVQDAGLTTSGALFDEVGRAVQALKIPHKSMDNTVRLLTDTFKGSLLAVAGPLDQPTRDKIAAAFVAMAADLEGLK